MNAKLDTSLNAGQVADCRSTHPHFCDCSECLNGGCGCGIPVDPPRVSYPDPCGEPIRKRVPDSMAQLRFERNEQRARARARRSA
jgi:hypothetical protein